MTERLLFPVEVARRWRMHEKTLAQWRWQGKGPDYVKVGRRVFYRREDVERFEVEQRARARGLMVPSRSDENVGRPAEGPNS
jgi:hypothetical protein